ncbi:MAG: hypothetical protein IAF08_08815 [Rhizobacter sp.]|nr:hypothetical protein [Chlorobiales bacterium]
MIPLAGTWTATLPNGSRQEIYIPAAFDFEGRVVFERTFRLPKDFENKHIDLQSEGIASGCEIFINDQFIRSHTGSGTVFSTVISSEYLKFDAENKLTIVVSSKLDAEKTIPVKPQAGDPKTFGGIFRNLYLSVQPEVHFEDIDVQYAFVQKDSLQLNLRFKIKSGNLSALSRQVDSLGTTAFTASLRLMANDTLALIDRNILFTFQPESDRIISEEITVKIAGVKAWRPSSPSLYRLEFALRKGLLPVDDLSLRTGFRSIKVDSGKILLNGEPLRLKGLNVSEESERSASAMSEQDILRDLQLVKLAGANAIRLRCAPNPLWTRLCDSLGIVVLCELPVRNVPPEILGGNTFTENSQAFLREWLESCEWNPSAIAIGLGNGIDAGDAGSINYLKQLAAVAREEPQLLCYFSPNTAVQASNIPSPEVINQMDFIGFTGDGIASPADIESGLRRLQSLWPEQSITVLGYGVAASPDNHNGYSDARSLEHQAKFLMDTYKTVEQLDREKSSVLGVFAMSLTDYHLARPPLFFSEHADPYLATTGLTSFTREKKSAFQMVKSLYDGEKIYNPPIGNKEPEFSPALVLISVVLTALLVFALNQRKRLRENVVRAMVRPFSLYQDIRDQRINIVLDPLILLGILSLVWGSILAALAYSSRGSAAFEFWFSHAVTINLLKEWLNWLTLTPLVGTLVYSLFFILLSLMLAALIKLYLFIGGRSRVNYLQVLNVWVWSGAHWVLLVFIAAFIDRLESTVFVVAMTGVSLAFFFFSLVRLFRGLGVICEMGRVRVQVVGFLSVAVALSLIIYLYDRNNRTAAYIEYWQPQSRTSVSGK